MNLERKIFKTNVGGEELSIEVSKIAGQANAAVFGTYGGTTVLVTVVMEREDRDVDYLPLTVDYEEKFYAAGKILGSRFARREGKAPESSILSGRLIDRAIRPLFDKRIRRNIQVVATVLSYDEENDPDFVSLVSASTALGISNVPWNGPIAGLRVFRTKDNPQTVINPKNSFIKTNAASIEFDSFVAGPKGRINMIELGGYEAKKEKAVFGVEKAAIYRLGDELVEHLKTEGFEEDDLVAARAVYEEELDKLVHREILKNNRRPDGRKLDEFRELHSEVGILPRTHGSALFIRGTTQALAVTTLASPGSEQLIETIEFSGKKRFM